MQIRITDLRKRVQILWNRMTAMEDEAYSIKTALKNNKPVKEYEIDMMCRYYVELGRHLEAENMLLVKGVAGV